MSQETLSQVPITSILNKGADTLGSQTMRAVVSESASIAASPFRFKDTITSKAAYGRYRGYADSPKGEALVYVLSYVYLQPDGTFKWFEEAANLGAVLRACRGYDWTADPLTEPVEAVDMLASVISRDMHSIEIVQTRLNDKNIQVIHGDLQPTKVSRARNIHKKVDLSLSDIARVLSKEKALVEAVDIAAARKSGPISSVEWKHDLSSVAATQVEDLMRVAATIQAAIRDVETGGYVVTKGMESCDSVELALDLATKNIGFGARMKVMKATEDPFASSKVPLRKVDHSTDMGCVSLVKDYFVRKGTCTDQAGTPSLLGVIPSGLSTELIQTTIDASSPKELVEGLRETASDRALVSVSSRTMELLSTRAKSGGAHFLCRDQTVKSVSHVHFMQGKNGNPLHCLASIRRTRKRDNASLVTKDDYEMDVLTTLSPKERKSLNLVLTYAGETHWIRNHSTAFILPATEMTVRVHTVNRLVSSLACYPPAYCLEHVEPGVHIVVPVMNAEFDSPSSLTVDVPRARATTASVSSRSMGIAADMVRILQSATSLRCSLLHELSCATAHEVSLQWAASACSEEFLASGSGLVAQVTLIRRLRTWLKEKDSKNARKKKVKELRGALILQGWIRKAFMYSAESVEECLYYPREMDSVHNTMMGWAEGEETEAKDGAKPLEAGPVAVGLSAFSILADMDDDDGVGNQESDADSIEDSDDEDMALLMASVERSCSALQACMIEGGIPAARMGQPEVDKSEVEVDAFGNAVRATNQAGQAVMIMSGEDVDQAMVACEQYDGFYIKTARDAYIPRYASCAKAIRALLRGACESALVKPGGHMSLGAVGTLGMVEDGAVCVEFMDILHSRTTHWMDMAVGLGNYKELKAVWAEARGGVAAKRTHVSYNNKLSFILSDTASDAAFARQLGYTAAAASSVTSVSSSMYTILSASNYRYVTEDQADAQDEEEDRS
jgi:hypothetical protein